MDKKKILIIAVAVFLVIAAVSVFLAIKKSTPEKTDQNSTTTTGNVTFPTDDSNSNRTSNSSSISQEKPQNPDNIVIATPEGNVEISDPKKIASSIIDENNIVIKENPKYQVVYFNYNNRPSFLISILDRNLDAVRAAAEDDLLSSLGITRESACKLDVSLAVSQEANLEAAGPDYGLSFCPDGKPFPKK